MDDVVTAPLSDAEIAQLVAYLDDHSPLDFHAVKGVFHAVAIAPGLPSPVAWVDCVLPEDPVGLDEEQTTELVSLLTRLFREIREAVDNLRTMTPEADDVEACKSFAEGYLLGAGLDPAWKGSDARWSYTTWAAILSGQQHAAAAIWLDEFGGGDAPTAIRRDMGTIILATRQNFLELPRPAARVRIGRNDPCPCGSGKKYKRCCIDERPGS